MRSKMMTIAISLVLGATILGASALPTLPAASAVAQDAETVLHSGEWSKASFKSSGTWQIVERDGSRFVELSSDFKTRNAPDLKIFLSSQPSDSLTGKNATDSAILISELESNRGGHLTNFQQI